MGGGGGNPFAPWLTDGLTQEPVVPGDLSVLVLTLHKLGDLFVPV